MKSLTIFVFTILILFPKSGSSQDSSPSNREIQNLTAFAKVYGYTKYFHPSDEAQQIDWNKLAVLGVEKVKNAQSNNELKNVLDSLFVPIAPTITISKSKPDSSVFLSDYIDSIKSDTTNLETIAWQHFGVNLEQKKSVYTSSRLNRNDTFWNSNFLLLQTVNVQVSDKSTVRLRAMVKTKVDGDQNKGEMFIQIRDQEDRLISFADETNEPIRSDEWKEYIIETSISSKADQITAGIKLKGEGELWVDDLELEILDGESQAISNKFQNSGFENQVKGRPIGWQSTVTGSYDFNTIPEAAYAGKYSFYMESNEPDSSAKLFEEHAQVGETTNQEILDGLWIQVPLALFSNNGKTLPESSKESFKRLKKHLSSIELNKLSAENLNLRVANVIIAWNELQHFYPYFEVIGTDWEEQLRISIKKALTDETPEDFYDTLSSMLAVSQDGHIMLRHNSISNEAGMPFLVDWIENKVVVTHSLYKEIQPGDIIISINGKPATEVVQDQRRYISGSPQLTLFRSLRHFGAGEQGTEAIVQIERNEEVKSYKVQRSSRSSNNKIEKNHLPVTGPIENGIYYVDLDRAPMERIEDEMSQIASSPGVIFDVRGYPNSNHKVIQHLLTRPDTSDQWMKIPKIIYPDQQNIVGYQNFGWQLEPAKPHITGDVVFITDARAISYAESFMSFIEHYNLAEIIGQPTAGTNGNVNSMVLPGGYRFGWTGLKATKHDGSQHHLIGIQPTIPVQKTIQGVREGKDEFLEKAIQVLKESDS